MQYSVDNLVRLAKRANNTIRPYLYVNPLQGKHIPTRPDDVMSMCRELAQTVNTAYPDERLYVIGFAETATGIAALSWELGFVKAQGTAVAFRDEIALIESIKGIGREVAHSSVIALLQVELHHLSHIIGCTKKSCVTCYSTEHGCSLIIYITAEKLLAEILILL